MIPKVSGDPACASVNIEKERKRRRVKRGERPISQSAAIDRSIDSLYRPSSKIKNMARTNSSLMEGIPDEIDYSSAPGSSFIR